MAGVGDDEVLGAELDLGAVDERDQLAGRRGPHDDHVAEQLREVEGVLGLPALHQHVVRDIHHVVHRPQADGLEAALHPVGRGAHLDVGEHACGVAWAEVGVVDLDSREVGDGGGQLVELDVGDAERVGGEGGDLACDADVAEQVGPVRGDLHLDADVVADGGDRLDLEAQHGEARGEVLGREIEVHVVVEPLEADVHHGSWASC